MRAVAFGERPPDRSCSFRQRTVPWPPFLPSNLLLVHFHPHPTGWEQVDAWVKGALTYRLRRAASWGIEQSRKGWRLDLEGQMETIQFMEPDSKKIQSGNVMTWKCMENGSFQKAPTLPESVALSLCQCSQMSIFFNSSWFRLFFRPAHFCSHLSLDRSQPNWFFSGF